ncbi:O-antigen polysaccharide polymerase Wzy [Lachnospiraceae bacterium KGMB03038]|nr:O-antigen polysaccharide polymerase Wzy [Lachnospiraceae bacterium KGMB03038]
MKKCIRYSFFVLAVIFAIIGWALSLYNFAFLSIMSLFLNNVIFCFENLKDRIALLMFHVTVFVFLLSRPFIEFCTNLSWWNKYVKDYGNAAFDFALLALELSLLFLFVGGEIAENLREKGHIIYEAEKRKKQREVFLSNLRIISEIVFFISMSAYMIGEFEKLWFMRGRSYTEYYTSFASHLPYIIHLVASFMKYSLCIFLATFPKKKCVVIPLGLYFLSAVPSLLIGMRNPIMLNGIFVFIYFCIRSAADQKEKWIGKFEKVGLTIAIPVVLIFMGAYSYIRSGTEIAVHGLGKMFVNFFYGQGVSFEVLMIGYNCIDQLPQRAFRNYTFGGIVDYFLHGTIAQKFFGAVPLDNVNSIRNAMLSNNFSHNMSYISKGDKYLAGQGWGSSYLLETYVDYGYIGIILYSFVLALVLVIGIRILKKYCLGGIIILLMLTEVFFAPRAEATGFLNFIVQMQFWAVILMCFLGAALCCKKYEVQNKGEKECLNILG